MIIADPRVYSQVITFFLFKKNLQIFKFSKYLVVFKVFDLKVFDFKDFKFKVFDFKVFDFKVFDNEVLNFKVFDFKVFDFKVFQNTEPKISFLFIGSENSLDSTPTLATPHDLSTPTAGKEVASSS